MKGKLKYWMWLCLLLGILWVGWTITPSAVSRSDNARIIHLLNRTSFGIAPGDIQLVKARGIEAYIQEQLSPESIPEPPQLTATLQQLETTGMTPIQLWQKYGRLGKKRGKPLSRAERQMRNRQTRQVAIKAVKAHIFRSIASQRQLQEVMVDFWFNHFNVFLWKGLQNRLWVGDYEQNAIRPHALGKFRDLLAATTRHPAMLFYLDNWQNTAPNSPGARGRFKGLNENYARELMELHTLGVDGGYTQEDVVTLARIFTGWGIVRSGNLGDGRGFYFNPKRHDRSDKVFLGIPIQGRGVAEVEQALDILAAHPATAKHISYKLAQYFVADEPPESLVNKLSQTFSRSDGDITEVLATLFSSKEFWKSKYYDNKFKTPYQYITSIVRATGVAKPNLQGMVGMLRQLKMLPYGCPTPNGYPNTQEAWLNPDAMLRRLSFATAIANGRLLGGKRVNAQQLANTLDNNWSAKTQQVLKTSPPRLRSALILGSPEMMYR